MTGKHEKAKERREKRLQEISLLRTIPYSDHQRWWSSETIAVVTGANRGIGFEMARQLAAHGLTVILTSRDTSVGLEAAKVLQEGGLNVDVHQLDVLDSSSIQEFCDWIRERYGGIDILVNNAGVNYNLGSDNSVEFAKEVIQTNYYGTKAMIKAMIPLMRPSAAGARIVSVSSRLGRLNGRRNRPFNKNMASLRRAVINVHRILSSSAVANRSSIASASPAASFETLLRPQYRWVSNITQSLDIDLSNEEKKKRMFNRLLYRSKQRGFLELDLVLGKWVKEHIHSMDENGIKALVDVLDLENPDLWKWLTGQEQPPEAVKTNPVFSALHNKVMNNLNSYASPETRSKPGQPWVRGWDDFKKGRDSPLSGNQ